MRKKLIVSGIGLLLLLSAVSAQDSGLALEEVPSGIPPEIDGIILPEEWIDANVKTVDLTSSDGRTRMADRYLKFDNGTFYFALVVGGESEEVYIWLGDDKDQAFQKGTDIKRCMKYNNYSCSDFYYRELYDMVEDSQQNVYGVGRYNAETEKTTIEFEIPFDSGDINDYTMEYDTIFTIVYGSIHESSPAREYTRAERVRLWKRIVEWWKKEVRHLRGLASIWGDAVKDWEEEAAEWDEEAADWKEEEKKQKEAGNQEKANEAKERAKNAKEKADHARKYAGKAKKFEEEANKKADLYEMFARTYGGEKKKGFCLGTLFIVIFLVVGSILCIKRAK
jgi:hypothetical protein